MNKVRWLSVLLGLGTYLVLAALGHLVSYLYLRNRDLGESGLFAVFVWQQLNPWVGGVLAEDVELRGAVAWLLGLAAAVVVVALSLVLTARAGQGVAAFTGGWLGSILGCGFAGLVSMAAFLTGLGGREWFDEQWSRDVLFGVMRGLYWGAAAGWLVGLAAAFGAMGSSSRSRPVDSPPPPVR
jgi:hypothetical protein